MTAAHDPAKNQLLQALAGDGLERLIQYLEPVDLPLGTVLHESGDVLHYVCFPVDCIVSLLHSVDQQLCRWLLLSLDRLPSNQIFMTQELISNMLGVRREGVTEAAGTLQRLGIIQYPRGHITVLDRPKLETLCCECYEVVKRETDRLIPRRHKGAATRPFEPARQ